MKHMFSRASALLAFLLIFALLATACGGGKPADETSHDTVGDVATQPSETLPETEGETTPPVDLSADELKTLLADALAADVGGATVTTTVYLNENLLTKQITTQKGGDFLSENSSEGVTERMLTVGDTAYYYVSMSDGESESTMRYVMKLTDEEKEELIELYILDGTASVVEDPEISNGLLNCTLTGKKYADGHVELSCTEFTDSLIESLMGDVLEGATMLADCVLDAEGRLTFIRLTMTSPAEEAGEEAMTLAYVTEMNYASSDIVAPADAADYVEATYDDLFGYHPPEIDPDEAAAAGLPVDGDNYTMGGENPAVAPEDQFSILYSYAPYYENKTFTVYGNVITDEFGNVIVSLGEYMDFAVYFDGVAEPVPGSYVKVTGIFTKTVDMGDYADFDCFTLMATACEVLGEAKGPNGGKFMFVTASSLNVRSEPDSSKDNKVGLLSNGDMVEVLETGFGADGNWCKITFDCDAGYAYISMSYVSETRP